MTETLSFFLVGMIFLCVVFGWMPGWACTEVGEGELCTFFILPQSGFEQILNGDYTND